jgi:hypothetical protein
MPLLPVRSGSSAHRPSGKTLTAWGVRVGILVVVVFNVACAIYVGSYMHGNNALKRLKRCGTKQANTFFVLK